LPGLQLEGAGEVTDLSVGDLGTGKRERQALARRRETLSQGAILIIAIVAVIPVAYLVRSNLVLSLMTQAVIAGVLATSVGFLIRQSGAVTFGNAAFYGTAAYCVALPLKAGLSLPLGIALALVIPPALAYLLGLVIVRIPGIAFSMLTLAIGQALSELALKARWLTGGEDGFSFALPKTVVGLDASFLQRPTSMLIFSWSVLVLVLFGLSLFSRSRYGRVVAAIRENEERARFIGYQTVSRRAATFALSAFVASIGGVLATLYNSFVSPETMHWSLSGMALIMAIIGGTQLLWGAVVGAAFVFFAKDWAGDIGEHWQAVIGVILIVVTVGLPGGISGAMMQIASRGSRLFKGRGAP